MHEKQQQGALREWTDYVQRLTNNYNQSVHSVIGVPPEQAEQWLEDGNEERMQMLQERIRHATGIDRPGQQVNRVANKLFKEGDLVRFRTGGGAGLAKSGGQQWSDRPAKVTSVEGGGQTPVFYEIEDAAGNPINTAQDGPWRQDLLTRWVPTQLKTESTETRITRKILRPCVYDGEGQREPGYVVSWFQPGPRPSCEPRRVLEEDIPAFLLAFETRHSVKWQGTNFQWVEKPAGIKTARTRRGAEAMEVA
jgi:hypothetical protein